ncbi:hypothetical protein MHK_001093 [Candidatus Magnetomorum sp. HK-1]|nr:hypothetical protein MHK_001093 [Candidatus Magnetomorum sp. HK-1]
MMPFIVGSADSLRNKSSVYVDGGSVMNGASIFNVSLKSGPDNLSANNFKLYKIESSDMVKVYYWYPLQPSFWWDNNTPGNSTGRIIYSMAA